MIIFDLDGTLADCEHRRHFVDYTKIKTSYGSQAIRYHGPNEGQMDSSKWRMYHEETGRTWKPDYKSFYEACDKDQPILPSIHILEYIGESREYGRDTPWVDYDNIEIWSGRCESVRKKTAKWIYKNIKYFNEDNLKLKMRPIGDNTPDEILKERWLRSLCNHISLDIETGIDCYNGHHIDFVFDSDPKSIAMWRSRGVFVFDCNQSGKEF